MQQHKVIPLTEVIIDPNRIRKEFNEEKHLELARSIETLGLLQLPILRREEDGWHLVSGHRRIRALGLLQTMSIPIKYAGEEISSGSIPFLSLSELPPDVALEIELHENIMREDISWQERAEATKRLHELRQSQSPDWKAADTARELEVTNMTEVNNRIILAKHLDNKHVAAAKTERQAMRNLRKEMEKDMTAALGRFLPPEESSINLTCCDAIEGMKSLPDASVEIILTDPPYGINAHKFTGLGDRQGDYEKHKYDDSPETVDELMVRFAAQAFRICAEESHAYIFCDTNRFLVLRGIFIAAGFTVWGHPYIWTKNSGQAPDGNRGPRHVYEGILFAAKGGKAVNRMVDDVLFIPQEENKVHAAQKPVALYKLLLEISAIPGDTVLDPFAGSGTIFVAARELQLEAIGFEKEQEFCDLARGRMMK